MKSKKVVVLLFFSLFTVLLFSSLVEKVEAALEPGSVQFDKDFSQQISEYVQNQPAAGPFTGKKEDDLEKIIPFIYSPSTRFKLDVDSENDRLYRKGEEINLPGKLAFSFQSKEDYALAAKGWCQNIQKENPESQCQIPTRYTPEYNDLGIFVQVFRRDEDKKESIKGDYLIDEFYAEERINDLKENEAGNFNLKWKIPAEIKEGNYYFSLYVNSNKRFSLSGFPVETFSAGAVKNFIIAGEGDNGIEIDKNNLKINGRSFVYRAPSPTVAGAAKIEVPVVNLNPREETVNLNYLLSGWSQEDPSDKLKAGREAKTIAAGGKQVFEINIKPDEISTVQNVKILAETPTSKSSSNIRFVEANKGRGLFRFLGLARSEDNSYLPMFCIRNANYTGYFDGKVKLTVTNKDGNPVVWEKEGAMKAKEDACFIVKNERLRFQSPDCIKTEGEIFDKQNRLVDKREISANCKQKEPGSPAGILGTKDKRAFATLPIIFILFLLLVGMVGILILIKTRKENP